MNYEEEAPELTNGSNYSFTAIYYMIDGSEVKEHLKARSLSEARTILQGIVFPGVGIRSGAPLKNHSFIRDAHSAVLLSVAHVAYATVQHDYVYTKGADSSNAISGFLIHPAS